MAHDLIDRPSIRERRAITDDLKTFNVSRIVLSPNRWSTFKTDLVLNWTMVRFEKSEIDKIPDDQKGVYSFVVCPGIANHPASYYLMYIGKAEDQPLRTRIKQYFQEVNDDKGRAPVQDMIINWNSHLWVCYTTVSDIDKIDSLEDSLISAFVPPINQKYKGTLGKAVRAWKS
jgi:hypothetical protein